MLKRLLTATAIAALSSPAFAQVTPAPAPHASAPPPYVLEPRGFPPEPRLAEEENLEARIATLQRECQEDVPKNVKDLALTDVTLALMRKNGRKDSDAYHQMADLRDQQADLLMGQLNDCIEIDKLADSAPGVLNPPPTTH